MGKGRTAESAGALLTSSAELEAENAQLKQSRKDLGRFMDIDREKFELEMLQKKKKELLKQIDDVRGSLADEIEKIRVKMEPEVQKLYQEVQNNAAKLSEKGEAAMKVLVERDKAVAEREKKLSVERSALANSMANFVDQQKIFSQNVSETKQQAKALFEAIKPFVR